MNDKNSAPIRACVFAQPCEVEFAAGEAGKQFSIIAYSGQALKNHWFWGNLAFDLKGMEFAKKKTPVLEEHFTQNRIGFTTSQDIKDKVKVEGQFLSNETATKMRADIEEGFPMQASLKLPPTVVEHISEGASAEVNGHTLKGPGTIFRKSTIVEVSMCVHGFDQNTASKAFAGDDKQIEFKVLDEKENIMSEKKMTVETFKAEHAEIFDKVCSQGKADGEKTERDRLAEFMARFGEDAEFCLEVLKAGKSIDEAAIEYTAKLKSERDKAREDVAKAAKAKATATADPATQEFTDDQTESQGQGDDDDQSDEDKWKAEFNKSAALKDEFAGKIDNYIAFKKAEAEDRVAAHISR